jgi:hypothetical protein
MVESGPRANNLTFIEPRKDPEGFRKITTRAGIKAFPWQANQRYRKGSYS